MYEYEHIMTFDQPMMMAGSSSSSSAQQQSGTSPVKKKKSIKSDNAIDLRGPMEVDGSVKSMASLTFSGDFWVRDRIEAYGNVDVGGNLTCRFVLSTLTLGFK